MTLMVLPLAGLTNRLLCKLGKTFLLVALLLWLMLKPIVAPAPVIWQTLDILISINFLIDGIISELKNKVKPLFFSRGPMGKPRSFGRGFGQQFLANLQSQIGRFGLFRDLGVFFAVGNVWSKTAV